MPSICPYALHWFRRDLRVAGNAALARSARAHGGRVLGVFCFDEADEARPEFSVDRTAFLFATLRALRHELRGAGGDLLVLDAAAPRALARLCLALEADGVGRPAGVSFNRDYTPAARGEEDAVVAQLAGLGVTAAGERDHLVIEPEELRKPDADPRDATFYRIYTPFARRWLALLATPRIRARLEAVAPFPRLTSIRLGAARALDALERLATRHEQRARVPLPPAGHAAALARLRTFRARLCAYATERDRPAVDGTSRLSMYLRNGSLTTAQVIAALDLAAAKFDDDTGRAAFLRELVWREFSFHILAHRPDVATRAFLPQMRDLAWENREDWFEAWKTGRTGYPIVDAGMRQLTETGFMHNRLRMIAASFLTKDLLIDWRWGERHFLRHLLDGDLAPNNAGWQWAASTGCDAQPYFRVFNPTVQSRRFDPDGAFVRAFLPERRQETAPGIHEPRRPIVVHDVQRAKALALYRRSSARGAA